MGQLDNFNWINLKPIPFLEYNNITVPIQRGGKQSGWFALKIKVARMVQSLS